MADLLPCPFCGSTNLRYEFAGSQGYIQCDECGTEGPCDERAADPHCDIEAAEGAWNRRLAPVPVLLDERMPGPENCDEDGYCWFLTYENGWTTPEDQTFWLPFHALLFPITPPAGQEAADVQL